MKDYTATVVVDSGDAFFAMSRILPDRLAAERAKAELIVDAYNMMETAALNVGDRDLAGGREALQALAKRAKFPFVSANLVDAKTRERLFAAGTVVKTAAGTVGVFGLLSARSILPKTGTGSAEEFAVLEPVAAAKEAVADLKKKGAGMIVLLSQLSPEETVEVLKAEPAITLVLGGQNPKQQAYFDVYEGRLSAQSFMKGKHIGVVAVHLQKGSDQVVFREHGEALVREIGQIDQRIRMTERQLQAVASRSDAPPGRADSYKRTVESLVAQREGLAKRLTEVGTPPVDASFATFDLVPLGRDKVEDPALKKLVDDFKVAHPAAAAAPPTIAIPPGAAKATRDGIVPRPKNPALRLPKGVTPRALPIKRPPPLGKPGAPTPQQ